jgi:iron(III)-enterobactin esterase
MAIKILNLKFGPMQLNELSCIVVEQKLIYSSSLRRYITIDLYLPKNVADPSSLSLLIINDGQDLAKMPFDHLLNELLESQQIQPVLCVGVHAGRNRKKEYGTAGIPDFKNRGSRAEAYEQFIIKKLIPHIQSEYCINSFKQKAIAGFSLGGLTAIDLAWKNPAVFSIAGVFSGSLWWRSKDISEGYNEELDRIMHRRIREGNFAEAMKFYFTTGSLDETADRNNNGIIDSIDDTLALIEELKGKGYPDEDIVYINFEDGHHDVETWGRAMPGFLKWAFGGGF